jgi:preprotein translocase subunit SecY
LMTIPETIGQFLSSDNEVGWFINDFLLISTPVGLTLYIVFIIAFSFFYSNIQLNPQQLAENFEKSGKFIPGIKSGEETRKHITKVLNRVNWIGAPFLALIAAFPYFVSYITKIPSGIALGGTGIIIIVSATLEVWASIKSNALTSGYNIDRQKIEKGIKNNDKITHKIW